MNDDGPSSPVGIHDAPAPRPARRPRTRRPSSLIGVGSPSLLVCILVMGVVAGCDESFEPIASSSLQLSVYGYLDASADTQWIRVTPIRPVAVTAPDSFGGTVTVEQVGSGRVMELRDSVFRMTHWRDPEIGSEGSFVHNFWTAEPIEPGATYRFSARREGQEPVEAVVEVPGGYEVEVWIAQLPGMPDYLHLVGLEHLAFVGMIEHFTDSCRPSVTVDTGLVRYDGGRAEDGVHMVSIQELGITVPDAVCAGLRVVKLRLWVVGSGAEWPSGDGHAPAELIPERASNITNSVGFLGGVLTRVVPYERCELQGAAGAPPPEYCWLRYDEQTATLRGRVTETRCHDGPIDRVGIELREVDGEPPDRRRIRITSSGPDGRYEVGALEPGIRYALKARVPPTISFGIEFDDYTIHHDTLSFAPGEQRDYDIQLERLTDCSEGP